MTVNQAAEYIGCTPQHVRTMIYNGKIKARRVESVFAPNGFRWEIAKREVEKVSLPSKVGRPRSKAQ